MILPLGFNTSIPTTYKGIEERLLEMGLAPSGNAQVDKYRLINAIEQAEEAYKKEKKVEKVKEEDKIIEHQKEQYEETKLGAQILGEQNRIFFGI